MVFIFEEKEISKRRYDASTQVLLQVFENFGKYYYFDLLPLEIHFTIEENKHLIYGRLLVDANKPIEYRCLGFLEVNKVHRRSDSPVDVRLVCAWPPVQSFWEELDKVFRREFHVIEQEQIASGSSSNLFLKPAMGATREEWFRYKLNCDKSGSIRFTHKMLAKELSLEDGYSRTLYAIWKKSQET
jgi:hypothetical protein